MNEQIEAMRKMGMSEEEIADVLESDKRIDKGEKLFELDPELEKSAKKARQADRKLTAYNFQKRERKADNDKREIIQCINDALCCLVDNVEVINPEREILFIYNEKKYKVVLSAPRS